ncbi:MAG TPA: LamG-like jellyroll fold domain-containing protein [Verrucomicrobiae bacterium]|nr:LamG-like jellyroll fold domain-containing protein [Verrucomicrobiae bacterium]
MNTHIVPSTWSGRQHGTAQKAIITIVAMAVVLTLSSLMNARAAQIGLKIGINGNGGFQSAAAGALLPEEAAGAPGYAQMNWNVLGRWGSGINPTNSAGNPTTIIVNWDATGFWSQQGGGTPTVQGSPDGNLMNAYNDSNGNGNNALGNPVDGFNATNNNCKPWMYFQNLSAWMASEGVSSYDVVVYSDGDATAGRGGEFWLQNATGPWSEMTLGSDITTHAAVCDRANFVSTLTYTEVPLTVYGSSVTLSGQVAQRGNFQGNYVVFNSITNDSFLLRRSLFNTRIPINAVQIVPRATPLTAQIDPLPAAPQVFQNGTLRLQAQVAGVLPFSYQWKKGVANLSDGGNISGSTTATLVISNFSVGDAGLYSLTVNNPGGTAVSTVAAVSLAVPAGNSYAEKIATNLPVAYWRFNETGDPSTNYSAAYDYVGRFNGIYGNGVQNGYNGVVGPQPAEYPGFESGNPGMTTTRNVAHSWVVAPPLGINTNTVTMCAWIYPTTYQAANTGIISSRGTGTNIHSLGFANNGNNNTIGYTWNNANFNFVSGLVPLTNAWSFIAVVITPTNAVLYCYNTNGQLSATNTVNHGPGLFEGITTIGTDPSATATPQDRAFSGTIDEVAVFNRALPQTEIYNLYKKGLGLNAIGPTIPTQPKSLALYEGRTAKFQITASGDTPLTYQWRRNNLNLSDGGNISGANTPSLTINNVSIAANAGDYDIVVGNIAGSVTSSVVTLTIVASNSTPAAYEAQLRQKNPVAYWRFSEPNGSASAFDYWGGNIATNEFVALELPGPATPDFVGLESTNTAAQYDGFSASTATTESLMNNRAQFSIIGWFNTAGPIGERVGLFGQNDVCEFGFHGLGPDGLAQVGIWTPRGAAFLNQTNIMPGVWYMVAAVGSGTNVALTLVSTNGGGGFQVLQAVTSHAATTNYGSSGFPFRIGGGGILDVTGNFFTGVIDEVAVYDRALSVGELSDLFGAALTGGVLPPGISSVTGPTTLYAGRTATFQVNAVGTAPQFQWRSNGVALVDGGNLSGSLTPTLTITGVTAANAASYDVIVSNSAGSVTSAPPITLTVITPVPGSYEATVIAASPLAYYRLNSTNDPAFGTEPNLEFVGGFNGVYGSGSQNGFNNILGPQPPIFTFETDNPALATFSATANSFATAPFGSLSTNNVTFTMWIQPTGAFDNFSGLLMNRGSGVAGGFGFGTGGQLGYTWNNNNANTYNFASGLIPPVGEWSFAALVVEPARATIYLYSPSVGLLSATNAIAHTPDVFGNNWRIGHDNNDGNANRTFNGLIDEVAVFNYSLTPAQLLSLYAAGAPVPVSLSITQSGSDVTLTWGQGTLLQADEVTGPWTTNTATSPYTTPAAGVKKFYRVIVK